MAKNIDVESAMAEAAQYIVGPEEAEKMLKNLKKNASYMDAFEDDDYEVLADVLDFLRFQPNDPLVTKGEDASWCGFIMEGSVGVVVGGKQVAAMPPGKLIGGMAYFFGATRTADCCGGENGGVLAAIEFDALRELEKNSPKIALRFINCIATGELENLLSRISRMEGTYTSPTWY
jgi:CRP-like cAMP-binding protein